MLLGSAGAAGAQTITIASGALDLSGGPYTLGAKLTFVADRGVATSATISPGAGVIEATTCASLPDPHACRPGDALSLRLTQSGTDLPWDPITLDGTTYTPQTGRHFDATSLSVAFAGSVTLPSITDVAVITAPFSFSGVFRHPAGGTDEDHPVLEQLQGRGTVSVYLRQSFVNSALWQVTRLLYVFQSFSPGTSSTPLTEQVTGIPLDPLSAASRPELSGSPRGLLASMIPYDGWKWPWSIGLVDDADERELATLERDRLRVCAVC